MRWLIFASLIVAVALILVVRRRGPFRRYLGTATFVVGVYAVFALLVPEAIDDGGMGGFRTWALLPGTASLALICALPPWPVWRFFQPVVAWMAALYWLALTTWIA